MQRSPALGHVVLLFVAVVIPVLAFGAGYDSLIQDALAERNRGDMEAAERHLRDAYALATDRSEVRALLAMVLAYQERFEEAEALVEEGLAANAEFLPLQYANARIQYYQGHLAEATAILRELLANHPSEQEARDLLARIELAGADERGEVEMPHDLSWSVGRSTLNRPWFSNWYDHTFEYRHHARDGDQRYVRLYRDHRFDSNDNMVEAGWLYGVRNRWPVEVSLAFTSSADFLPKRRWRVATYGAVARGWRGSTLLHVAYQQSRYRTGSTRDVKALLEHYIEGTDLWVTPGVGVLEDEGGGRKLTWQIGIHDQFTARLRGGATWIDAPETENNITTESRTAHAYVAWQATHHLQLRLDIARNLRRNSYTRETVAAGVRFRF